jgi:hypothetical protein
MASADVPQLINYQGRLTEADGRTVADSTYELVFEIYPDSTGGSPLWTNEGPSNGQPVEVRGGLFTYQLGSATALPPSIFDSDTRWLSVSIYGETGPVERVRIVSVPYAYRAHYAENVPAGGGWVQGSGTVYLADSADRVGIGVSAPTEPLVIGRNIGTYNGNRVVIGDATPGASTGLVIGENSNNRSWLLWSVDDASLSLGAKEDGTSFGSVLTMKSGNIGIGTTTPGERLTVGKNLGSYPEVEMITIGNDAAGGYAAIRMGEDNDNNANIGWSNDDDRMYLYTKEGGDFKDQMILQNGRFLLGATSGFAKMTVKTAGTAIHGEDDGTMGGTGVLGKSNDSLGTGVKGMSTGNNAFGVYATASGYGAHAVHALANNNALVAVYADATEQYGIGIEAHGGVDGMAAKLYGDVSLYSAVDEDLIMVLGEGLDYAEGFDATDPAQADPGTVVSIDPDHPGRLQVCREAYDTKVAGIVAGANGLGSGVRLGADRFDLDVALAGRVYCKVEATQTAIKPGDLLTTSPIAGYAMKASDARRAQGAILGKAMESLELGATGLILVLVTLQ